MIDRPGALGSVATRIGAVRGDLTGIEIIERRNGWVIDELRVDLPDPDLSDLLIRELGAIEDLMIESFTEIDEGTENPTGRPAEVAEVESPGRHRRPGRTDMPKAYWISAYHAVHDEEKLAAYAALAGPAIAQAGGRFLARGVAARAYEAGLLQRTVVVEFDSLEAAEACHDGAPYQAALAALGDGVTRDLRIVEGLDT